MTRGPTRAGSLAEFVKSSDRRINSRGLPDPALGLGDDPHVVPARPHPRAEGGQDSIVRFNPGTGHSAGGVDSSGAAWAGSRSDVILFHELVHVLDLHSGVTGMVEAEVEIHVDGEVREDAKAWRSDVEVYDDLSTHRMELRAVGLGPYAADATSENAYRAERREIGAFGVGRIEGDEELERRTTYYVH